MTTAKKRKSCIRVFLWVHIGIFLLMPVTFGIAGGTIILHNNLRSIQDMANDKDYTNFCLAATVDQAIINIYIAILLLIIQGRTI